MCAQEVVPEPKVDISTRVIKNKLTNSLGELDTGQPWPGKQKGCNSGRFVPFVPWPVIYLFIYFICLYKLLGFFFLDFSLFLFFFIVYQFFISSFI